nr:riboflavin synthase [bacterium]
QTVAQRQVGDKLNLERALALGDRLGGHLVAGHVDGVGTIRRMQQVEGFVKLAVDAPEAVLRYCVAKGSIALDGVSLTINVVDERGIELGIIPTTWTHTTLADKKVGDRVNLEADLIGKYVERILAARLGGEQATASRLDEDFLAKHGFVK